MPELIERKTEVLKQDKLVTLSVWFCFDTRTNEAYNHEYTVTNDLSYNSTSYSKYYHGDRFRDHVEKCYQIEVDRNEMAIEKVKQYLGL